MQTIFSRAVLKERRRSLRRRETGAEYVLWHHLKGRNLLGLRFLRQFSADAYILDFYCPKIRLAIELDGGSHDDPDALDYDRQRTEYLNGLGIEVMRFRNEEVLNGAESVLRAIVLKVSGLDIKKGLNHETPSSTEEEAGGSSSGSAGNSL